MSSKDTSFMYSGITSVSAEPMTPRQKQRAEKVEVKQKLKPAAEIVLGAIEKERETVVDIRSMILDRATTEQEVNTELLARKLYLGYLNGLEAKIKNVMKDES